MGFSFLTTVGQIKHDYEKDLCWFADRASYNAWAFSMGWTTPVSPSLFENITNQFCSEGLPIIAYDALRRRHLVKHDPALVCVYSNVESYNAGVINQLIDLANDLEIRKGKNQGLLSALVQEYQPLPAWRFDYIKEMCIPVAEKDAAYEEAAAAAAAAEAERLASLSVSIDPSVGGSVAVGIPPEQIAAAQALRERFSREQGAAEEGAMIDPSGMVDNVVDQMELERRMLAEMAAKEKRKKYIMYGGIAAAVLGAGMLGYKMLAKPKKKRRRRKKR